MVTVKVTKKCKMCTNASKTTEDFMVYCRVKCYRVWCESLACDDYDDTEIF